MSDKKKLSKKIKRIIILILLAVVMALAIWIACGNSALELNSITVTSPDLPLAFDFSDTIAAIQSGTVIAHKKPSEICASTVMKRNFSVLTAWISSRWAKPPWLGRVCLRYAILL